MTKKQFNERKRPGGVEVDYLATKPQKFRKTSALDDVINDLVNGIQFTIRQIRDVADEPSHGQLDFSANEAFERWNLLQVGHSRSAWMERGVIFAAMLLDHRSRQFGRQAQQKNSGWRSMLDLHLGELAREDETFQRLSTVEYEQALFALVFSGQWQKYLNQLLIRPPGDPPPANAAFPQAWICPNDEVSRIITEMSYCRPVGAFFVPKPSNHWHQAGGRETCRKRLACPNCHATYAARLVHRVEQGPWRPERRHGKRLVFLRLAVSTEALIDTAVDVEDYCMQQTMHEEAVDNRDLYQIRTTDYCLFGDKYSGLPGDATMIANIDCDQSLNYTLTRHEVSVAHGLLKRLVRWCRRHGMAGGIQFHSIGPKGRNFLHELSVVGEIDDEHAANFMSIMCDEEHAQKLNAQSIEFIVFAREHADAARLAIAGSSWKFNLKKVGAILNKFADSKCFTHRPVGLRGAMAWQPLFLMAGVSFWSRYFVLRDMKLQTNRAFGNWRDLLASDRQHKSAVQKERTKRSALDLRNSPATRLQRRLQRSLEQSFVTQSQLAIEANVSRSAVSRFVLHQYGSALLVSKLTGALECLEARQRAPMVEPPKTTLLTPDDVRKKLRMIGKCQRWLASQLNCSPSKVSRRLAAKSPWTDNFGDRVALVLINSQRDAGDL